MADRKKRRVAIKWVLAGLGLALLLALAGAWLSVQHVPGWYRPLEIAPEDVQAVRNDLTHAQMDLNELMLRSNAPFEYQISQERLNAWISIREGIVLQAREWLPPWVRDPVVTFDEQGMRVAATVNYGSVRAVLSARLAVQADEEQIHVRLVGVHCGSLPVPEKFVREQLEHLDRQGWNLETFGHGHGGSPRPTDLPAGVSLPNSSIWEQPNPSGTDRRRFRVIGVRFEKGSAVVTVRPMEWLTTGRRR